MKSIITSILLIVLLSILALFPKTALHGALDGLLLWFHTILPTLLPYMILTSLLMSYYNAHTTHSIPPELFALLGLICGYPMGAKLCADLVKRHQITLSMGTYLLPLCNLAGPTFIGGYVIYSSLNAYDSKVLCLLCIYVPLFVYALLSILYIRPVLSSDCHALPSEAVSCPSLDQSIMDSFLAITKLGGYIILFSILSEFMILFLPQGCKLLCLCLSGALEITNGISFITDSTLNHSYQIVLSLTFVSFGGISCICQTNSMIKDSSLSIRYYCLSKCIIALLTGIMAYLLFCQHVQIDAVSCSACICPS